MLPMELLGGDLDKGLIFVTDEVMKICPFALLVMLKTLSDMLLFVIHRHTLTIIYSGTH